MTPEEIEQPSQTERERELYRLAYRNTLEDFLTTNNTKV